MPKPITLLVTDIDGEVTIHTPETLQQAGLSEEDADACFSGVGYWLTLNLKRNTFADQQTALREAAGDDTLLPQKRFVLAVEAIEKRPCGAQEKSLPAVTEDWFVRLDPPALGNVISGFILNAWYPTASKTADFTQVWQKRRSESDEASKSTSSPSILAS